MTDIELRNENGKIVGYDSDGNKVPVSFEDAEADSFSTDELSTASLPADYVLRTVGDTIDALPQSSSLSKYIDETDIGTLLNKLIIDELPPKGSAKEAAGRIHAKRGHYPGSLTDENGEGVPLPTSCHITGDGRNHMDADVTRTNIPETEAMTLFPFDEEGFRQPDVDGDLATFPMVKNLHLRGPGPETAGSVPMNGSSGSNQWDWLILEDVVLQSYDKQDFNYTHHLFCDRVHFIDFNKFWDSYDKSWFHNCGFWSEVQNSTLQLGGIPNSSPAAEDRGELRTTWLRDSTISMVLDSPLATGVEVNRGHVKISGCHFNNPGSGDAGTALLVSSGVQTPVQLIDNHFLHNNTWDEVIVDESAARKSQYIANTDHSTSTTTLLLDGANGVSDTIFEANDFGNGITEVNSPTRPRYEGTIELTGAPTAADYDSADRGVEILDTSVSPPDVYWVAADGSLLGPK